jgi:hypothetical protein
MMVSNGSLTKGSQFMSNLRLSLSVVLLAFVCATACGGSTPPAEAPAGAAEAAPSEGEPAPGEEGKEGGTPGAAPNDAGKEGGTPGKAGQGQPKP